MSGVPYSDDMYSGRGLDSDADDDLYAALTGNGGNDSRNHSDRNGSTGVDSGVSTAGALSPSDGFYGRRQEHGAASDTRPPGRRRPGLTESNFGVDVDADRDDAGDALYHRHDDDEPSHQPPLPQSSQVPHVPDVWVTDPSLVHGSTAESKAREAEEERAQARRLVSPSPSSHRAAAFPSLTTPAHQSPRNGRSSVPHDRPRAGPVSSSSAHYPSYPYPNPASSSARLTQQIAPSLLPHPPPFHRHQQQLSESSSFYPSASASVSASVGATGTRRSASISSERSSLLSEPPPPAYTPSPTSPPSSSPYWNRLNYQSINSPLLPRHSYNSGRSSNLSPGAASTDSDNNVIMGRPSGSERHGLLAGQTYQAIPQNMGGNPNGYDDDDDVYNNSNGRHAQRAPRWRRIRHIKMVALALVLLFVTVGFLVSSFSSIKKAEKGSPFPGKDTTSPPNQGNGDPNSSNPQTPMPNPNIPITRPIVDVDGTRLAYPVFDSPLAFQESQMCGSKIATDSSVNLAFQSLVFSRSHNITLIQDIKPRDNEDTPATGRDIHVNGNVVVRRAGPGTPWASLVVESISNDKRIQLGLDWDHSTQQLRLITPRNIPSWSGGISAPSPCIQVRVTLWVPPESVLDAINFQGIHLGLQLLDNLSLSLASFARFSSTVGPITAATDGEKDKSQLMHSSPPPSFHLNTRYLEVKTTSASISGSWPLYDYLGLESLSGAIHAGVRPQSALAENPLPAILYAKSTSGRIELFEPIDETSALWTMAQQLERIEETTALESSSTATTSSKDLIPPREYDVNIRTMSGTVKADLAFGRACRVHTTSGSIDLTLLPVLDQRQAHAAITASDASSEPRLETASTSGTTKVHVLDALWWTTTTSPDNNGVYVVPPSLPPPPTQFLPIGERDPYSNPEQHSAIASQSPPPPALRLLSTRHATTSAKISVRYPDAWEGYIEADSLSGSISLSGRDVDVIRQDEFASIAKHLLAHKGKAVDGEEGKIKLHSTSGNIQCVIGSTG